MKLTRISVLPLLLILFVLFVSCDTEDPFQIDPPDFSTVPEPYDTSSVESVSLEDGVRAYIHDEGYGEFHVTLRDQVNVYLTLRTESGEIIYSTFSSDRASPEPISMSLADGKNPDIHVSINRQVYTILLAYTPGFKEGLLGMRQGEQRTLVVSPEKGYKNIPTNNINEPYKESTLVFDILVSNIFPKKSQSEE